MGNWATGRDLGKVIVYDRQILGSANWNFTNSRRIVMK